MEELTSLLFLLLIISLLTLVGQLLRIEAINEEINKLEEK